jgi:hypothetical protein
VDSRGVPTTVPHPSLCGQSRSPHNCTVSFSTWTVGESPQLCRILLYVDSREVPTTGPYPSLRGQSGSPHNWTVSFFLWTVGESPQLDRQAKQISITAAGQKQVQLPQRGSLRNTEDGPLHLPHCILFLLLNTNTNKGHSLSSPTPSKSVLQLRIRMPGGSDFPKTNCRYEVVEMYVSMARSLVQPPA